jgi:GTP cyclohydrolase IA
MKVKRKVDLIADGTRYLENLYEEVLEHIGALSKEPDYMDLSNTPARVVRMLEGELLASYKEGAGEELIRSFTTFPSPGGKNAALVTEVNIPFFSLCSHHMLPFFGVAHVGYVPNKKIAGLSKIPRVVDFYSRKLQIQERLVGEVADFIVEMLDPLAVLVYMEARHFCMEMRGVRKAGVLTRTSALRPVDMAADIKSEFYSVIAIGK